MKFIGNFGAIRPKQQGIAELMGGSREISHLARGQSDSVMQIGIEWGYCKCVTTYCDCFVFSPQMRCPPEQMDVCAGIFRFQLNRASRLRHCTPAVALPGDMDPHLEQTLAVCPIELTAVLGLTERTP